MNIMLVEAASHVVNREVFSFTTSLSIIESQKIHLSSQFVGISMNVIGRVDIFYIALIYEYAYMYQSPNSNSRISSTVIWNILQRFYLISIKFSIKNNFI